MYGLIAASVKIKASVHRGQQSEASSVFLLRLTQPT